MKTKFIEKLKRLYYKNCMSCACDNYNFDVIPNIVEKYRYFDSFDEINNGHIEQDDLYVFKQDTDYYVYYGNIKIYISIKKEDQHVVRMYLKKNDDIWDFESNNNIFEIYFDYNVIVLDDKRCWNTTYNHGAWDEYVYKTIESLIDKVNGLIDYNQFNVDYNGKIHTSKKHTINQCCKV